MKSNNIGLRKLTSAPLVYIPRLRALAEVNHSGVLNPNPLILKPSSGILKLHLRLSLSYSIKVVRRGSRCITRSFLVEDQVVKTAVDALSYRGVYHNKVTVCFNWLVCFTHSSFSNGCRLQDMTQTANTRSRKSFVFDIFLA